MTTNEKVKSNEVKDTKENVVEHCGGGGNAMGCSEGDYVRYQAVPRYGDLWEEAGKGDK